MVRLVKLFKSLKGSTSLPANKTVPSSFRRRSKPSSKFDRLSFEHNIEPKKSEGSKKIIENKEEEEDEQRRGGGRREGGGVKREEGGKKEEEVENEGEWVKKEGAKKKEGEEGREEEELREEVWDGEEEGDEEEEAGKESRVGRTLSELTMKRVIIIVLLLIFVVPLFDSSYYFQNDRGFVNGLRVLTNFSSNPISFHSEIQTTYQNFISEHKDRDTPLVFCQIPSINGVYMKMRRDELRGVEKDEVFMYLPNFESPFLVVIDIRVYSRINAGLSVCRTVFVCLVLLIGM